MMYLIFVFIWIAILIHTIKKRATTDILNPIAWLILSWSFLLGSYLFSGITYYHDIKLSGWLYMFSFFVVFFFVFYRIYNNYIPKEVFLKSNFVSDNSKKNLTEERFISIKKYFIIGIIGTLVYLFDFVRLNSLSDLYMLHDTFQMTTLGGIGLFLLCSNSFVWLYQVTYCIRSNVRIPLYCYIAAATQLIPYYLISGRQGMIIIGLEMVMLFGYNLGKNKNYKYKKLIFSFLIFAFIAAVFYFVDVSTNRSTVSDMNLRYVSLETVDGVYFSNSTKNMINKTGNLAPALMTIMYYFSHQFRSFQVFLDYYSFWPLFGAYEFHYIARRLGPLDLTNYAYVAFDKMQIASGLNYHVYRTALAAFIVDFGWIGAYVFLAVLASCIAKRFKSFKVNNTIYDVVFQIIICTGIFFSIEYSPFSEQIWGYSFFWVLLIPSIEYSLTKKKIAFIKTI